MRVVLAGLFVFGCIGALVILLGDRLFGLPETAVGVIMGGTLWILCAVAYYLFNPRGAVFLPGTDMAAQLRYLEEKGLLTRTDFHALRAFQVEEWEDEGLHYFLELENGSVLYLSGQYLMDYDPMDDDPDYNQARQFPCTEFTITRHRTAGHVLDIACRGTVLEPECTAPPFVREDYHKNRVPEDGDIIVDRTYEQIKEQVTGPYRR